MRPDPYKIARSKRYLAKKRATHGSQSIAGHTTTSRVPRWITLLPSNEDRYADIQATEEVESASLEFDITDVADIADEIACFSGLSIQSEIDFSKLRDQHSEDGALLFRRITDVDLEHLDQIVKNCDERISSLPPWF